MTSRLLEDSASESHSWSGDEHPPDLIREHPDEDPFSSSISGLLESRTFKQFHEQKKQKPKRVPLLKSKWPSHTLMVSSMTGEKRRSVRVPCIMCGGFQYQLSSTQLVLCTTVVQSAIMATCGLLPHKKHIANNNVAVVFGSALLHCCLWLLQLVIAAKVFAIVRKNTWQLGIRHICEMYVGTLLTFAGFYITTWFYYRMFSSKAFYFPEERESLLHERRIELVVALIYFSTSTQTLCGVADITPSSYFVQFVSAVQMLVGIFYAVFIISFTLSRLGRDVAKRQALNEMFESEEYLQSVAEAVSGSKVMSGIIDIGDGVDDEKHVEYVNGVVVLRSANANVKGRGKVATTRMLSAEELGYFRQMRDKPWLRSGRRCTRRFLLATVVLIQLLKAGFEWYIDSNALSKAQKHRIPSYLVALAVTIDLLDIGLVVVTSLKFIHLGHMTETTVYNLLQCYLSCVVIFVGAFSDLQLFDRNSKAFTLSTNASRADGIRDQNFWQMLYHFTYFSFAVITLNGNGLNIQPHKWYACVFVTIEMLLGVFFHVVVFGLGLIKVANARLKAEADKRKKQSAQRSGDPLFDDSTDTLILSTLINS